MSSKLIYSKYRSIVGKWKKDTTLNCVRTPYNEESLAVDIIMPRRSVVATEQAESGIPGEQPSTALKLNPRVFIVKTLIFGLAVSSFFTYYYYTSGSFRLVEGAYDRVYQEQRQNEQVQTNVRGEQTQRHHPDSTNNNEGWYIIMHLYLRRV